MVICLSLSDLCHLKTTQTNGRIFHAHGLGEPILLNHQELFNDLKKDYIEDLYSAVCVSICVYVFPATNS